MSESEKARKRAEVQRGLMVDLNDMQARGEALDRDIVAWRKRWLTAYKDLDDAMDQGAGGQFCGAHKKNR